MIIKTTAERLAAARGRLVELHPYEVPEVVALPVADGIIPTSHGSPLRPGRPDHDPYPADARPPARPCDRLPRSRHRPGGRRLPAAEAGLQAGRRDRRRHARRHLRGGAGYYCIATGSASGPRPRGSRWGAQLPGRPGTRGRLLRQAGRLPRHLRRGRAAAVRRAPRGFDLVLKLQGCADDGLCYPPQTWTTAVAGPVPTATAAARRRNRASASSAVGRGTRTDGGFLPMDQAFAFSAAAAAPTGSRCVGKSPMTTMSTGQAEGGDRRRCRHARRAAAA